MKKAVALVLVVVMMLAFGATAFAAQEPCTTVNCCTSCGDGQCFPDPLAQSFVWLKPGPNH